MSISSQRGTMGELIPLIEQAVTDNPGIPSFVSVLAGAHTEGGRIEEAGRVLEQFVEAGFRLPDDMAWMSGMVTYAEAAVEMPGSQAGRTDLRAAPSLGGPTVLQRRHHRGPREPLPRRTGDGARAIRRRARHTSSASAEFCARVRAKCFGARTDLNWARLLLERGGPGDLDRACELLQRAHTVAVEHGYGTTLATFCPAARATGLIKRRRAAARDSGGRTPKPPPPTPPAPPPARHAR